MTMERYKSGAWNTLHVGMAPRDDGEWVRYTDALAFAAQEYDRALEDAARVAFTAETSTAPAVYRMRIAAAIRAMKKGTTDEA
jgi:predicted transcriptional regulator